VRSSRGAVGGAFGDGESGEPNGQPLPKKESNSLEEVDAGLIHAEQSVYTEYPDPRRGEWQTKILLALKRLPLRVLIEKTGLSRRALLDIRAGRSSPHPRNEMMLKTALKQIQSERKGSRTANLLFVDQLG
jgi:hypothetical protein